MTPAYWLAGHKDQDIHLYMLKVAAAHGFRFETVQVPVNVMDAHFRSFIRKVMPELVKAAYRRAEHEEPGKRGHSQEYSS